MKPIQILFTLGVLLLINPTVFAQQERTVDQPKGLSVGTNAPMFEATTQNNQTFKLQEALKKGPVVVVFYRGQWCPICNRHLSNLQDSLNLIHEKGAQVIAISPEKQEQLKKTVEKTGAAFTLLYDKGYKISDAFDLTFTPDKKLRFLYNTALGANLKKAHSDDSERLPIPATFIINQEGVIIWRQFDADYKNRSTVKEILNQL